MSPPRVAVIGGGVAACSLAHGLRDSLASRAVSLHVFEMGRASGGRAATRGTRDDPGLRVDHGVPAFAALTPEFGALCESLVAADVLRRCDGDGSAFGVLRSSGTFEAEDAAGAPTRYRPPVGKGMNALCDGLLGGESTLANFTPSTMVTKVEPVAAQWRLTSKGGVDLGTFDWLVVSSTGLAHPRWRTTFGGEPPLVEAAAALGDTALDATLAALVPLQSKPAAMLAYGSDAAAAWASLPFFKAQVEADPVLSRIVVQRVSQSLTAVVLHSTHEFARSAAHVYGATSTAARIAGAKSDAGEEGRILDAMLVAAEKRLGGLLGPAAAIRSPAWGPHLHRWGAAFPDAPLLPEGRAVVPSARVAFCGDFVEGGEGRGGSVEGAALSGLRLAKALQREIGGLCGAD
ncbi:hypothetical protein EMIHUDRAFT_469647 [Emiliania huxleyi CCMP1516]|uniref:Amine oxidase domain-containing protein n=2 Tax=Emiliania huxleyi TaxID=2903 RepID=A0A0D3JFZ1_EMIH1|nr:hypothetical protein EMIHUDRAFT_469647 [Emiliania huxleyi CCMP1516]EOD22426.1 hypothetical protein EMIHUDRAFT_469647 [Emiliania huxleyi CCMP1516]|eukprot:XP_005774855.1 hypothetical protein EMIHUDRAFT_469647 [Emiliania huxleyi CCMP1516]